MKILITGGTGFVGQRLLKKFDTCVVTSRSKSRAQRKLGESLQVIEWQSTGEPLDLTNHEDIDGVVNLMGESIAEGRWTPDKKERIRKSRVEGTSRLVDALLALPQLPRVVVSASAVGIYGDCGDDVVDESYRKADGFLADVCHEWEEATQPLVDAGVRVVTLRVGIVLGREGGALAKLLPMFRLGLGGKLGNGKHYVPWIHVEDLVSLIQWSVENDNVVGPVNGTAPNPIRNSTFTKAIANAVRRPAFLPAPKFALKLALGEFADSLFSSQQVIPKAALDGGFQFKFSQIDDAMREIVQR